MSADERPTSIPKPTGRSATPRRRSAGPALVAGDRRQRPRRQQVGRAGGGPDLQRERAACRGRRSRGSSRDVRVDGEPDPAAADDPDPAAGAVVDDGQSGRSAGWGSRRRAPAGSAASASCGAAQAEERQAVVGDVRRVAVDPVVRRARRCVRHELQPGGAGVQLPEPLDRALRAGEVAGGEAAGGRRRRRARRRPARRRARAPRPWPCPTPAVGDVSPSGATRRDERVARLGAARAGRDERRSGPELGRSPPESMKVEQRVVGERVRRRVRQRRSRASGPRPTRITTHSDRFTARGSGG